MGVDEQTAKDRLARAIKAIDEKCRRIRCWLLRDQHQSLSRMLKGHFAYFGLNGNHKQLASLRYQAERCWRKWLSRRSAERSLPWVTFQKILACFPMPRPTIRHPYTGA